jgi:hypothetical protein
MAWAVLFHDSILSHSYSFFFNSFIHMFLFSFSVFSCSSFSSHPLVHVISSGTIVHTAITEVSLEAIQF